jgi:hypothetical protein
VAGPTVSGSPTMLKKDDIGGGIPLKNVIDEPLVCNTARVIFLFDS